MRKLASIRRIGEVRAIEGACIQVLVRLAVVEGDLEQMAVEARITTHP